MRIFKVGELRRAIRESAGEKMNLNLFLEAMYKVMIKKLMTRLTKKL